MSTINCLGELSSPRPIAGYSGGDNPVNSPAKLGSKFLPWLGHVEAVVNGLRAGVVHEPKLDPKLGGT